MLYVQTFYVIMLFILLFFVLMFYTYMFYILMIYALYFIFLYSSGLCSNYIAIVEGFGATSFFPNLKLFCKNIFSFCSNSLKFSIASHFVIMFLGDAKTKLILMPFFLYNLFLSGKCQFGSK